MIRFVFVALLFAGLVYLFVRALQRRGVGQPVWGPVAHKPHRPQRRSVAPDDDDDFLRDLDRKRKKPEDPKPET